MNQDLVKALRWLHKAAGQGIAEAKAGIKAVRDKMSASASTTPASSSHICCANCGVTEMVGSGVALKSCSRCKAVVYCGVVCETKHWKAGVGQCESVQVKSNDGSG